MSQLPPDPTQPGHTAPPQPSAKASGAAIAALVLGILGMGCFPLGLVALILGVVVLGKTRDGEPGRGFAIAGIATGASGMVISILLMIAILLPALGAARRTARRMQNSTQLAGMHQGMFMHANSNKNYYPGLTSKGQVLADGAATGNSGDGNTPQARFWVMFNQNLFTPEYAISPSETEAIFDYPGSGSVQADHYSYALLGFDTFGGLTPQNTYGIDPATAPRAAEWSQSMNSQAIVLSDRNTGTNTGNAIQSVHTDSPGNWRGSVLWNDNHVNFENTPIYETKYVNGSLNMQDHLFEEDTRTGHDALMVHE